ncbi:MFS transporter [Sphingobacterium sp. MYb382]|uniref:MFS transporter n=1 Tax=Sphingobacterium sp. MYb382 TaxID=2745278 RepID=UPI0030B4562E
MKTTANKWLQHAILLAAPLLTVIDVFIVNIAIPSIKENIHASDAQIELIIAAYLVGYASFMITGSRAGDFWGRKKVFMWGMLFFVLSSCVCGLAQSPMLLIIARFFQGVSGAFMTPQALSYVQILFPEPKERTKAIGWVGITLGIASLLGQFLGGYFAGLDSFMAGWRFIFFINLPLGVLALLATYKFVQETKMQQTHRFDYQGVALLALSLSAIIFPLTEGRELGWPLWSIVLLLVGLCLIVLFWQHQRRLTQRDLEPLVNNNLFKIKTFNIGILMATFYFMMHTSFYLISTIYLQNGLHMPAYDTGVLFVYSGVLFMLASLASIRLVAKFGKRPVQVGILLMMLSFGLQGYYFGEDVSYTTLLLIIPLTGLAGGLVLPSLINFALKGIPQQFVGAASGVYNTTQQIASSFGICLVAGFFFYLIAAGHSIPAAYHQALFVMEGCLAVVFLLSMRYKTQINA